MIAQTAFGFAAPPAPATLPPRAPRRVPMFFMGTHMPSWLAKLDVPLFVSRRRLFEMKTLPRAKGIWALDSGAFTELLAYRGWSFGATRGTSSRPFPSRSPRAARLPWLFRGTATIARECDMDTHPSTEHRNGKAHRQQAKILRPGWGALLCIS